MPDYLGMFAVTGGIGAEELVKRFEADHDDYNAIMVKALADRLAEAFATLVHSRVRDDWGHPDPATTQAEDLHHEKHRGIRPAPGYPACPGPQREVRAVPAAAGAEAGDGADRVMRR